MPAVETVVFLSLVLDLFAFTIPLPLFPRIIEWYTKREAGIENGFLSRTLAFVSAVRSYLYKPGVSSKRWDVVLLGGLMGSLFSTLQFLVSPWIGTLSDIYGRRNVLLITMIGNILSALVWIQSTTFASYTLSRAIGGLSEGNVQLAIAILSDVTTPANRSRALAHVGIAFAICFVIGPPIGAYFASRPFPLPTGLIGGAELNIYATPAALTLLLLLAETAFLFISLPETKGKRPSSEVTNGSKTQVNGHGNGASSRKSSVKSRLETLKRLKSTHFWFLGVFSGVEFTLTFLTYDLFDWNNTRNGALIGYVGIVSALLQGGYVRRSMSKVGEEVMAKRGVTATVLALVLMSTLSHLPAAHATKVLYAAATCLAFTSATVVNSLTAAASLQCDDVEDISEKKGTSEPLLAKGRALGEFRSSGQLGRAIGPILACASYWTFGPAVTYATSAAAMTTLMFTMSDTTKRRS